MKISLKGSFKSLSDFESEELPDFTVITGKNGSGKSQLLDLITQHTTISSGATLNISPNLTNIQGEFLRGTNFNPLSNSIWNQGSEKNFFDYQEIGPVTKQVLEILSESKKPWSMSLIKEIFISYGEDSFFQMIIDSYREANKSKDIHYNQIELENLFFEGYEEEKTSFLKSYLLEMRRRYEFTLSVSNFVAQYRFKKLSELRKDDFYKVPYPDEFLNQTHLIYSKLEFTFYFYAKRRNINAYDYFKKAEYKIENKAVDRDTFLNENREPWKEINELFSTSNFPYHFNEIKEEDFDPELSYQFTLFKNELDIPILYENLSSGEQIIFTLIVKLFLVSYYPQKLKYPDLIILDEPDANLHPEMSKLLIDVLNKTFVQKLGIKVIMTTHSPTTIALCPEDSVYQLENYPKTSLKKVGKDPALKLLTSFIPTLSIDYKNHKQVFVESPTDVNYYQTIFNKLDQERQYPFKLYFISNSKGKGNSDLVYSLTKEIRKSENLTFYGIVDWDKNNKPTEFVKVHGLGNRYSVENFLFDPLYFSILFMEMGGAENIYKELNIDKTFNHYSMFERDNSFLQNIANWFFEKIAKGKFSFDNNNANWVTIEYFNERKVSVPKEYLEYNWHNEEYRLKEILKSLEKFTNEGEIQEKLSLIMARCFPLIPMESVKLIEEIIYPNKS